MRFIRLYIHSRHSGAGQNPAFLYNMPFGFVLVAQGNYLFNWIPACAGMT